MPEQHFVSHKEGLAVAARNAAAKVSLQLGSDSA